MLAAGSHDPSASKLITMEFPLDGILGGSYPEKEETIVRDAKAILREANLALDQR